MECTWLSYRYLFDSKASVITGVTPDTINNTSVWGDRGSTFPTTSHTPYSDPMVAPPVTPSYS